VCQVPVTGQAVVTAWVVMAQVVMGRVAGTGQAVAMARIARAAVPVTGRVVATAWAVMAQVARGRVAVMEPVVAMARVEMGLAVAAARVEMVARRFVQKYWK
jgi:hypothetical protein